MKTIGIVGSRSRDTLRDHYLANSAFEAVFEPGDRIVSGGCDMGGDRFAMNIARNRGLTIIIHYPDWAVGKAAGFIRNTKIAEDCDILIALSADGSRGTQDTINKARKLGKKVVEV